MNLGAMRRSCFSRVPVLFLWNPTKVAVKKDSWGERRGLNPRPSVPQTDALPAELRSPNSQQTSMLRKFLAGCN